MTATSMATTLTRAEDSRITLLKRTMPFQVVSNGLLGDIAALAQRRSLEPGERLYMVGDPAEDIYVVVSGRIEHALGLGSGARTLNQVMATGDVFGWAALLKDQPRRLATATALEKAEVLRIRGEDLTHALERDPTTGDVVMSRFATMITHDFTLPEELAHLVDIPRHELEPARTPSRLELTLYRLGQWLASPRP